MNIQDFADKLNGREYGKEITKEEEAQAKALGFVVVFGYSDDNAEFRGAIDDEVPCSDGGMIFLDKDGLFEGCEHDCTANECKYLLEALEKTKIIEAVWAMEGYSWIYKTDIPHATFEVFDDGEPYCRGIVFEMKELEG